MSAQRRVSFKGRLFWFLLIVAAWFVARHMFAGTDARIADMLGHRFAQWGADEHAQIVLPGDKPVMEKVEVEHRHLLCPPVGTLELDDAGCRDVFAALPLGPQDLAVLLNKLKGVGVETVGISSPFIWPDEAGDMTRQLLCQVLKGFPNPVLGLRGRTAAQADFTPVVLRDYAIPATQVEGDPTGLPQANRPLPNGLTDTPDSLDVPWAPDWLQDEPQTQRVPGVPELSFPLLVRWNGQTMPTLPLRLAIERAGLRPEDVHVHIGKYLRLGSRTMPLDEHGRTRLNVSSTLPLNLAELMNEDEGIRRQLGDKGCVLIEQPVEVAGNQARLTLMARTLSQLAGIEKVHRTAEERPVGGRVLMLNEQQGSATFLAYAMAALALLLLLLPLLPGLLRFLSLLGLLAAIAWWARACVLAGTGASASAALICWALLLLATLSLRPRKADYFGRR